MGHDIEQSISPVQTQDWATELGNVSADMNGAPINVHKLMAHSPQLLQAWWSFRNYAVNGGTLGNWLGELVILRVATHLGSWYEWASHVDRAMRIGMDLGAIFETLKADPDLPEEEHLVLQAVDDLMERRAIGAPTRAKLERFLETSQVMDLIAIQGMYVILGGFIGTWGLELDEDVARRIEKVTNRETFEADAAHFAETLRKNAG